MGYIQIIFSGLYVLIVVFFAASTVAIAVSSHNGNGANGTNGGNGWALGEAGGNGV
jgi:hypothetical protein